MAYFNHAFTKIFLGTQVGTTTNLIDGFVKTAGIPTSALSQVAPAYSGDNIYGPGTYGFFDPKTNLSVTYVSNACCPLYLASASLMSKDKIGPFAGGYQESNKSKIINPKYIHKIYKVPACTPQQSVLSIGNTPGTTANGVATGSITAYGTGYIDGVHTGVALAGGTGHGATATITVSGYEVTEVVIENPGDGYGIGDVLIPAGGGGDAHYTVATLTTLNTNNFQGGTTSSTCCFTFLCGETYYLRIDMKGSPALRFLNHNAYQTVYAYTGCCPGASPTYVDSTLVMIDWAKMIISNEYLKNFAMPVVYDESGIAWYPDGTTVTLDGNATTVTSANWFSNYVSPGHTDGACAGIRLFGAYVETKFGNCSFQITDFFEKEPIQLYASMVDYNGDPCVFEGICVYNDCKGIQGMGFGEQVVRDLILSESYLQNFFATDERIREITLGTDILNSVSRNALYTRYFILHTVPRYNNPSGVFDNDQYMLEIISTDTNATLEDFLTAWVINCNTDCLALDEYSCTHCEIAPDVLS